MRRSFAMLALSALMAVGMVGSAFGYTLNVYNDPGTQQTTTGITNFVTTGGDMGGMGVTAYFADGNTATGSWVVGAPGAGSVTLTNPGGGTVTLSESGDTYFFAWSLSSDAQLARLVIDAGLGNSVFDQTFGGLIGTTGSSYGITFAVDTVTTPADSSNLVFNVTYRDIVALPAQAPVGDLWRTLDISIDPPIPPEIPVDLDITFSQDTDNLLFSGDIGPTPPTGVVPEPATILLLGGSLASLAVARRRKAR